MVDWRDETESARTKHKTNNCSTCQSSPASFQCKLKFCPCPLTPHTRDFEEKQKESTENNIQSWVVTYVSKALVQKYLILQSKHFTSQTLIGSKWWQQGRWEGSCAQGKSQSNLKLQHNLS